MIFTNYQNFLGELRIDENVQQAKVYLKKRALADKKSKTKKEDDTLTLTPEESRRAENNADFIKIRDLLRDNPGYVFTFVKFFFEEEVPFEELKAVYDKIKEYRSVIHTLPMEITKYTDVVPTKADPRKGFERLGDDIENIKRGRGVKKWIDQLYAEMKREYSTASPAIKEKIDGIAQSFEEFGKESNGTRNDKINKELQDLFFNKVRRYKSLNEIIIAATSYIKSANNASISKFFQNIQKINSKYGEMNGADIVYDDHNILILEVKSFQANKELNANTSHCIASSSHQWESYVGSDSNFNKQYYIYNFNLAPSDDKSVIGITIQPGRESIRACHTKSDRGFSDDIKTYMQQIKVPFSILSPMTDEDIQKKKKRIIANKEIIKPGLSTTQAKKYIEEGADPNALQGKPLINAVAEDNIEKVKYLLEMGAAPNIGGAIKGAKNLEMIKTLVSAGATITNDIFNSVAEDYSAIKYLLDAGVDVDFENGMPLRTAAKSGRKDIMELLITRGAKISTRRYMVVKWAAEWGREDILTYLLDKLEKSKELSAAQIKDWAHWVNTSDKITDEVMRGKVKKMLDERLKLIK